MKINSHTSIPPKYGEFASNIKDRVNTLSLVYFISSTELKSSFPLFAELEQYIIFHSWLVWFGSLGYKICRYSMSCEYLADPGEARGCSINISATDSFIN